MDKVYSTYILCAVHTEFQLPSQKYIQYIPNIASGAAGQYHSTEHIKTTSTVKESSRVVSSADPMRVIDVLYIVFTVINEDPLRPLQSGQLLGGTRPFRSGPGGGRLDVRLLCLLVPALCPASLEQKHTIVQSVYNLQSMNWQCRGFNSCLDAK